MSSTQLKQQYAIDLVENAHLPSPMEFPIVFVNGLYFSHDGKNILSSHNMVDWQNHDFLIDDRKLVITSRSCRFSRYSNGLCITLDGVNYLSFDNKTIMLTEPMISNSRTSDNGFVAVEILPDCIEFTFNDRVVQTSYEKFGAEVGNYFHGIADITNNWSQRLIAMRVQILGCWVYFSHQNTAVATRDGVTFVKVSIATDYVYTSSYSWLSHASVLEDDSYIGSRMYSLDGIKWADHKLISANVYDNSTKFIKFKGNFYASNKEGVCAKLVRDGNWKIIKNKSPNPYGTTCTNMKVVGDYLYLYGSEVMRTKDGATFEYVEMPYDISKSSMAFETNGNVVWVLSDMRLCITKDFETYNISNTKQIMGFTKIFHDSIGNIVLKTNTQIHNTLFRVNEAKDNPSVESFDYGKNSQSLKLLNSTVCTASVVDGELKTIMIGGLPENNRQFHNGEEWVDIFVKTPNDIRRMTQNKTTNEWFAIVDVDNDVIGDAVSGGDVSETISAIYSSNDLVNWAFVANIKNHPYADMGAYSVGQTDFIVAVSDNFSIINANSLTRSNKLLVATFSRQHGEDSFKESKVRYLPSILNKIDDSAAYNFNTLDFQSDDISYVKTSDGFLWTYFKHYFDEEYYQNGTIDRTPDMVSLENNKYVLRAYYLPNDDGIGVHEEEILHFTLEEDGPKPLFVDSMLNPLPYLKFDCENTRKVFSRIVTDPSNRSIAVFGGWCFFNVDSTDGISGVVITSDHEVFGLKVDLDDYVADVEKIGDNRIGILTDNKFITLELQNVQ